MELVATIAILASFEMYYYTFQNIFSFKIKRKTKLRHLILIMSSVLKTAERNKRCVLAPGNL